MKRLEGDLPLDVVASPPARRRGLKHVADCLGPRVVCVASRAEAWIETCSSIRPAGPGRGRLPRGGVD